MLYINYTIIISICILCVWLCVYLMLRAAGQSPWYSLTVILSWYKDFISMGWWFHLAMINKFYFSHSLFLCVVYDNTQESYFSSDEWWLVLVYAFSHGVVFYPRMCVVCINLFCLSMNFLILLVFFEHDNRF